MNDILITLAQTNSAQSYKFGSSTATSTHQFNLISSSGVSQSLILLIYFTIVCAMTDNLLNFKIDNLSDNCLFFDSHFIAVIFFIQERKCFFISVTTKQQAFKYSHSLTLREITRV